MKLLIVICDRNYTNKIINTLKKENIKPQMSFYGVGTADQSILSYFGLEKSEKEILLSMLKPQDTKPIMKRLSTHDFFVNHGAVAFTVPLDGISKSTLELIRKTEEK